MSILNLILIIVVIGVVLFLINQFIPMESNVKKILNWVVIGLLIFWLLKVFGVISYLSRFSV